MIAITAPEDIWNHVVERQNWHVNPHPSIFLGGTIEMGESEDWQTSVINANAAQDLVFYNPRRAEWDKHADEEFVRQQIKWELAAMRASDAILIYLEPTSLSPISMLEFGLWCGTGFDSKLSVVCPPGFWRRTNILVTAEEYGVKVFDTLHDGFAHAVTIANKNYRYHP